MNPQLMFLINFLTALSNLAAQLQVPYQVLLNSQDSSKERETAYITIDKIHRTMEFALLEM